MTTQPGDICTALVLLPAPDGRRLLDACIVAKAKAIVDLAMTLLPL